MSAPDINDGQADERGTFEHRIVSATDAARVQTNAAPSVFALGGASLPPSPPPPTNGGARPRAAVGETAARVKAAFEEHGELSLTSALARCPGLTLTPTKAALRAMAASGAITETRRVGRQIFYRLRKSGLKAWLEGQAKGTGTRNAPKRAGTAAAPRAEVLPLKPTHAWHCALVSTGQVVIEANGVRLALYADQARAIAAWLTKVDPALSAGLEAE